MKEVHDLDLHAEMDQTQMWVHDQNQQEQEQQHENHQIFLSDNDDDALMFYSDFPPLPDFPCMSSSSSSTPAPVKPTVSLSSSSSTSSSSSATSWAVLKSDADEIAEEIRINDDNSAAAAAVSSPTAVKTEFNGGDCTDDMMMETFGYMDLLEDSNEFFDPTCIFQNEQQQRDPIEDLQLESFEEVEMEDLMMMHGGESNDNGGKQNVAAVAAAAAAAAEEEDMAKVFLEWLRSNRETVSADDLRNVRIKKATIESAARRLGGGKEGMKQLLKLVLEWVQTNHLHKRKFKEINENEANLIGFQNPNSSGHPWIQTPPPLPPRPLYSPPILGYVQGGGGEAYGGGRGYSDHYQLLDSSLSWSNSNRNSNSNLPGQFGLPPSHFNSFVDNFVAGPPLPPPQPQGFTAGYGRGQQYPYIGQYFQAQGGDNGLVRLDSSATKEARKKRMARQRRFSAHHRHNHSGHHGNHHHHSNSHQNQMNPNATDHCNMATTSQPNAGNWVYWPSSTDVVPADSPVHIVNRSNSSLQNQPYPPRIQSDRRQGWKPEKNLRFLLQKVLKQSDVGNLGRIVLPKKEAESHLPELEARDGISLAMEDIGTSRVWNMRYRYWPNNKSRMYLLENTGDFVRANGLQEGDFIVIYSDVKCGKYMIRGVKVRQPGSKPDSKRGGKSQRSHSTAGVNANGLSSSPPTPATPRRL
ncbi:B3 domain-containing transcription factor ABI3 isoform X1 [Cucurbita moschata]|uniref:B3 domain-containing transcription factor ABI3 isoform X1 n=2 Tax=Cucurbita moschata TaxID=3662 RepID=A0A6J1GQU6_CUCMO|nr:B3 domain-containing transcription factor ABI3 isoform X1 [Cucurbita moschata]